MRRGISRDAAKEKIGADAYLLLGDVMAESYLTPTYRLSHLPILNDFTRAHEWAQAINTQVRNSKGTFVHIMSEMVAGYHDLCEAKVIHRQSNRVRPLREHLDDKTAQLPTVIQTEDGKQLPLHGLVALLASSRLLMDVDALGDSLSNTGYVVKVLEGKTIAQVVKVDPGFAFSFWASQNLLRNTISPRDGDRVLSDVKDIQVGSNGLSIRWLQLSANQQAQFRQYLAQGISLLRAKGVVKYLYTRGGVINSGAEEILLRPELVQRYTNSLRANLRLQQEIYLTDA
jgi:hypothetical protein